MDKHISSQFDNELGSVSSRVLELGGLVESQIRHAVFALSQFSYEEADQVIATEAQVNSMEVEIDRDLSSIIARRQPTARDLRLLIAISKITANFLGLKTSEKSFLSQTKTDSKICKTL